MTVNTQKLVRVIAGPTGPTGTIKGVRILSAFTGPTGTFPVWGQVSAAQQALGPTGTFETVYNAGGATGNFKTVIIPGFTASPNILSISQTDHAEDATSQTTYTWAAKNFAIGAANGNRKVVASITSRLATTGATLNSVTIGGVAATKIDEAINITGGAESITSVWAANVPSGTTATVSATFSTAMLRAGCDVWTVVGSSAVPSVSAHANNPGVTNVSAETITVPAGGAAIVFTSVISGTVPTVTPTNYAASPMGVVLIGGTMYYASGSTTVAGATTFTSTWSTGGPSTGVAVSFGP